MDSPLLTPAARSAVGLPENDVFVSAASAFEITTKHRRGKWPEVANLAADVLAAITAADFNELPISIRHAAAAGALTAHHKDPFDRILIAQAVCDGMTLVSNERVFDAYGIDRIW